jgi:hypothetical protein
MVRGQETDSCCPLAEPSCHCTSGGAVRVSPSHGVGRGRLHQK